MRVRRVRPAGEFVEFTKLEIEQSISARFERQTARRPNRLAVMTRTAEWTYAETNAFANRVAHSILARRGSHEEPVALIWIRAPH